MWIYTLAWKNIWRNKSRTIIVVSAIAFASIISLLASSLKEGIFQNLISNIVGSYSGHIQIHQKGYWQEQILETDLFRMPVLHTRFGKFQRWITLQIVSNLLH